MKRDRRKRRRDRNRWRRALATLVIAASLLAGLDVSLLESVFAQEKSGYTVEVTYTADKSQAVLKGNGDSLSTGITLGELKDKHGNTYDPSDFETTVTANGTYTYTLTYKETAAQTGNELDKEEKIEVKVDQIASGTALIGSQETAGGAESQTASGTTGSADPTGTSQNETGISGETQGEAPSVVALSTLLADQNKAANAAQTKDLYLYAGEAISQRLSSEPFVFSGGELNAQTAPQYNSYPGVDKNAEQREFSHAAFVYLDGGTATKDLPYTITGLYYYSSAGAWYYTTGGSGGSQGGDYGNISAAYHLPDNVEIRLYYSIGNEGEHDLVNTISRSTWNLSNDLADGTTRLKKGTKVVFELSLNSLWHYGYVTAQNQDGTKHYYVLRRSGERAVDKGTLDTKFGANNWTDAELLDENTSRYRVTFTMPGNNVTVSATSENWSSGSRQMFGIAITQNPTNDLNNVQAFERGATRFYLTSRGGTTWQDTGGQTGTITTNASTRESAFDYSSGSQQVGGFGNLTSAPITGRPFAMLDTAYSRNDLGPAPQTYKYYIQESSYRLGDAVGSGPNASKGKMSDQEVVWSPYNANTKATIPVGEYDPGRVLSFRIEDSRHKDRRSAENYRYIAYSLDIDVYYGAFGSGDFERYTLTLRNDTSSNTQVMELPNGARVIAICRRNGGTASITAATDFWGRSLRKYNGAELGVGTLQQDLSEPAWYVYDIVVEGMTQPFKLTYNHVSGAQSNYSVNSMDGVVESKTASAVEGSGASAEKIQGSYLHAMQDSGWTREQWRPLRSGDNIWAKHALQSGAYAGAFEVGLEPMEGYTRPKVTVTTRTGLSGASVTPQSGVDDQGRYLYKVVLPQSPDSDSGSLSGNINISAAPITFRVEYRSTAEGGAYFPTSGSNIDLTYGGTENYVLTLQRQTQTDLIKGYKMQVRHGGNKLLDIAAPSDNGSAGAYWLPGDVVNVRDIYQKLDDAGVLTSVDDPSNPPTYYIVLVPETASATEGAYTDRIAYSVYTQTGWSQGYADGQSPTYDDAGFQYTQGFIGGFLGSQVTFGGYRREYTTDGKTFVLDMQKSITQGTAAHNLEVGRFYYLRTADVNIRIPDELKNAADFATTRAEIDQWNADHSADTYVGLTTSDPDISHIVDLSSITLPGTANSGSLQLSGWRIVDPDNAADSYVFDSTATSLNLCTMGGRNGTGAALWDKIFSSSGSGSITIEPYYVDATKPITLTEDGGMSTDAASQVNVYEDKGTYTLSADFYMAGTVNENSTVTYAVYAQQQGYSLWGLNERGSVNLSDVDNTLSRTNTADSTNIFYGRLEGSQLSVDTDTVTGKNATKITLTFSGISTVGATGIDYRIYLWNSANGEKTNSVSSIPKSFNDDGAISGSFTSDDYPCSWQELHVIPKVTTDYSSSGITIRDTPKSALFYERTSFTVTGTFELEGSAKETFEYLNDNNLIHVALYKQNPPDSGATDSTNTKVFDAWANDTGAVADHQGKVSSPSIDPVAGDSYAFTVSFTIEQLSSITKNWDDNANYRIYVWTGSNVMPSAGESGITGTLGANRSKIEYNKKIDTIPSATTTMTLVLGTEFNKMISYPKEITMSDNKDQHIYSGTQEIILNKVSDTVQQPDPDPGVTVKIRELIDRESFNLERKRGSTTDYIALQGFLGDQPSGGQTTIFSQSGVVGTVKFKTDTQQNQNRLQMYFKSKDVVTDLVDAGAFTGQITFEFSQGSGN